MADNISITQGSGTTMATKDASGVHHSKGLVEFDVSGTPTLVSSSNPLPVSDAGGSLTVDGSVTVTQSTASNLKVDLSGTAANSTAIKVDGSHSTYLGYSHCIQYGRQRSIGFQ